jgi:hypothetical protein
VTNVAGMNPASIKQLRELKIKEELRVTDAPSVPAIDNKNWPKTMDSFQDCFGSVLGETKAPLACVICSVICNEAIVAPEADDPPANCDTPANEMIACVPHQDAAGVNLPTYIHDRSAGWQAISEVTRDDKC